MEVTQAFLDRIAAHDGELHAFLHVDADGALATAADVDRRRAAGEQLVAPGRRAGRGQGPALHRGPAHDLRLAHPRGLGAAVRRHRGHPAARGRHADPRQDQPRRVRDGLVDRALGVRPDPQPLGHRPHARRLRRRLGRRRRGPARAAGGRHRHRRLDPPARCADRHRRRQADLRRGLALRHRRDGQQPRPGRPGDPHRARRGAAARGHRRARPDGLDVDRRPGAAGGRGRPPRRRRRPADRRGARAVAARASRPACRRASTRPSSC